MVHGKQEKSAETALETAASNVTKQPRQPISELAHPETLRRFEMEKSANEITYVRDILWLRHRAVAWKKCFTNRLVLLPRTYRWGSAWGISALIRGDIMGSGISKSTYISSGDANALTKALGTTDWTLQQLSNEFVVRTDSEKVYVSSFRFAHFPGCCGIVISTAAVVSEKYRHRGIGTILNRMRISIARRMGFGMIICTDLERNAPQRKVLKKNGWRDLWMFKNPRTGNALAVSAYDLTKPMTPEGVIS